MNRSNGDKGLFVHFLPWLLLIIGAVVYANSLNGEWIYDDLDSIVENELSWSLLPPWSAGENSLSGRPIVGLTVAVNYAIGELDVRGYHVVNIVVHLLCGLLFFGIVRRTLSGPGLGDRFGRASDSLAFACALIWLVHPIQTECVNYITQRTESIMALFYLLTLYCAIRGRSAGRSWAWSVAAVISCGLGMASKESMVTAPLMVVLYDWAYPTGPFKQLLRARRSLYAGLAATWIILAALMATGPRSETVGLGLDVGPWQYALNQCVVITDYLRLVVWPTPLILDYGSPRSLTLTQVAPYAVVLAGLVMTTIVLFVRRPKVGYPAMWFFIILAPTSSVVPIVTEVAAERRLYLPLAGLIALAVIGVSLLLAVAARRLAGSENAARSIHVGVGALLLGLTAAGLIWATRARNDLYRNPVAIWQASVEAVPTNQRAYMNLGSALSDEGRHDEAIARHRRAVEIGPDWAKAHYNLGNALYKAGKVTEAIVHYRTAVAAGPDVFQPHFNLAMALVRQGIMDEEVIREFREAVRLAPGHGLARWGLARALAANRQGDAAVSHMRESVRLMPDRPEVLRDAAWMLATYPAAPIRDGDEAVSLAEEAARMMQGDDPVTLDVLAAAYAEVGDFDRAVSTARRAVTSADANGQNDMAARIRRRLDLYLRRTPYHVPQ